MNNESTPVRVSLPASIASDIGSLKKTVGSVLDKLGCGGCCSGRDIFWELQRDIVFEKDLERRTASLAGSRYGRAAAAAGVSTVEVSANPDRLNEIDSVLEIFDLVAEIGGHPACATGCDMRFINERILVAEEVGRISERAVNVARY